ncbi:MAG TPA: glycoside hydrolase family 3 N-terminal domain-containing protein [Candidatus Limnocylindrales bacterium]|jgi:beta-N-acetylhexosaminidase
MNGRRPVRGWVAATLIAAALLTGPVAPGSAAAPRAVGAAAATPSVATLTHLIGQRLMVAMNGTTPSPALLGRISRGEVGGVILFGANVTTRSALVALTTKLHAAATAAGQPRLLIAVDQEGGAIKRIPWAPPTLSPPQMGELASAATARAQGLATGKALKALGIDVDLAPIADVPTSTASFEYRQHRTWSFFVTRTAGLAVAFAQGLRAGGVIPVLKHFPGLGTSTRNTDTTVVTIWRTQAALASGLAPFRAAIRAGLPVMMLSNATYPAWDAHLAAGWSTAINTALLRTQLGFRGVTITDSLDGTAAARGLTSSYLAERAAGAGSDLILLTGSEASSATAFTALLHDAETGKLPLAGLQASDRRIEALKHTG